MPGLLERTSSLSGHVTHAEAEIANVKQLVMQCGTESCESGELVSLPNCEHMLHTDCMLQLLTPYCPQCRQFQVGRANQDANASIRTDTQTLLKLFEPMPKMFENLPTDFPARFAQMDKLQLKSRAM